MAKAGRLLRRPNPAARAGWHLPHLRSPQIAPARQEAPIRTPGYAQEDGLDRVRITHHCETHTCGGLPHSDAVIPSTGQEAPIRTPRHALHKLAMSTQRALGYPADGIPERHLSIFACTGQEPPIRAPIEVEDGGSVATHDTKTLSAVHIPYSEGATAVATEQGAAVGCEGNRVDDC